MHSIEIIPYSPELQPYFESINKAWVSKYFSLEQFDIDQLEHPEETILAKGGEIIFAKVGQEIVGTVALIPKGDGLWEMIKMGVAESFQGKGVGFLLGNRILELAREKGAKKLALYSSTKLGPALHLYEKLGFRPANMECGSYGRCDVKMEFDF
ncbi:GNAT family N-acetyltransferase [Algoriphagus sp. AK58]|uniref:GNAT family N-acetyltransferase n=1 Tax=Algoriphagus sp. AK58 TaxID=1406877 RepID=UPI0016502748|nr:GNAT family N-acetyltransferase [Algoriphagus sp. AK58]MBC6368776.1 GNAT family N-acetyltransferase [Algoriphagus sp. AK58]